MGYVLSVTAFPSNEQLCRKEPGSVASDEARGESTMAYTVEYWIQSDGGIVRTVLGGFDEPACTEFWDEMGVNDTTWQRWHAALSSGENYVLLSDFPQLSILASADEGNVKFSGKRLLELSQECQRAAAIVYGRKAQSILALLMEGTDLALERNGQLVVHPFGTMSPKTP